MTLETNDNAKVISALEAQGISFISAELYKAENDGHKFKPYQRVKLVRLENYPQFNGEIITITSIRKDGVHGKAYYFSTDNEALAECINWVYEYRLEAIPVP